MGKVTILALFFAFSALFIQAQERPMTYRVKIGLNLSNLGRDDFGTSIVKMCGGIGADYRFHKKYSLACELNYSGVATALQGLNSKGFVDFVQLNFNFIDFPLLAKYFITPSFALEAGIQSSFLVSAKLDDDENRTEFKDDNLLMANCSLPLGVSWNFQNRLLLDVRYNIGLSKLMKNLDDKNRLVQITAVYEF